MKMRHCFVSLVLSFAIAFQAVAQQENSAQAYRIPTDNPETSLPVVFDHSAEAVPAGYFARLRHELEQEMIREAQSANGKITLRKFTKDSLTFFVALGAVQMESLIVDYSDNPSGLQQHLDSLTDPIANLSFYLFMYSQGQTVQFLEKRNTSLNPAVKAAATRRISYLGMAAGSLVSGFSAEVITALKDCGKVVFSVTPDKHKRLEDLQVCESTMKTWTTNKKVQQYIPQIASLLISNRMSELAEVGIRGGLSAVSKTQLARRLAQQTGAAFKVATFHLATSAVPGGLVVKSVKVSGSVIKFAGFTWVDLWVNPYVQKFFGNLMKPIEFSLDAQALNKALLISKESAWLNQDSNREVAKKIEDVTEVMSDWRQQQLSKFYASHSVWGSNTKRVLDQTQTTFGFYKNYIDYLFETLQVGHQIHTKKALPSAMANLTNYPFRALPLFGVGLMVALPEDYSTEEDLYLGNPKDLETQQMKTIKSAIEPLKHGLETYKLSAADRAYLNEIVEAFRGSDIQRVGQALAKINDVVDGRKIVTDLRLRTLMSDARRYLGNPRPIFTPGLGFSYANEMNSFSQHGLQKMPRAAGAGADSQRTTDYLWLQMVCGAENKFYSNPWGMTPDFHPPKLVKSDVRIPAFCDVLSRPATVSGGQDTSSIYTQKVTATNGKSYQGINAVVYQNLKDEVLGDFRAVNGKHTFNKWWKTNVDQDLRKLYTEFDKEYEHVVAALTDNWSNPERTLLDKVNLGDYLEKDVLNNLSYELKIYAAILNDLMDRRLPTNREEMAATPNQVVRRQSLTVGIPDSFTTTNPGTNLGRLKSAQSASVNQMFAEATANVEDTEGFLRRLKSGDAAIVKGQRVILLKEIAELVQVTRARIETLRRIKFVENQQGAHPYSIYNFPDKATTKASVKKTREALQALSDLIDASQQNFGPSQMKVAKAALAGLQSVVSEVSSLSMAFYMTKYKMGESHEDLIEDLGSASQKEKKGAIRNSNGFNPRAGG